MKKLIALLVSVVLVFTLAVSASAVEFVPSIENKGAPELVVIDRIDGKDVVGFITGPDGNRLSTEYLDCLKVSSLLEALTDPNLKQEIKDELKKVYEELSKSDTKLSDVCEGLDKFVKDKWNKDKTANDLVVKDLFHINDLCGDISKFLPEEGSTLDLTFDLGIGKNVFVAAMVFADGKWQPVSDVVNNGDGTITVTFDKICPVAFMVPSSQLNSSTTSPTTGDMTPVFVWGGVMLASIVMMAALLIYRSKKVKA